MIFIFDYLRRAGTLIGLATGDSLGASLEGLPARKIPVKEIVSGGVHLTKAGDITDDTLQALAVAESIIENNGFFAYDIALRMCREYQKKPFFFGPTSSVVFEGMLRKRDPFILSQQLYESGGGRSNGSVMRGAPIGIFFPPAKTRRYSIMCSKITHYHPVACECTAFVNNMISRLCRGEKRTDAYDRALLECNNREVIKILLHPEKYPLIPSLDSLEATHCAVSVFMQSGSFEEMLIQAVNMGGDADTIGAVSGALGGAYWGLDQIPERWFSKLKDIKRIENSAFALAKKAI